MEVLKFLSEPRKIDNFILNMTEVAPAFESLPVKLGRPTNGKPGGREVASAGDAGTGD